MKQDAPKPKPFRIYSDAVLTVENIRRVIISAARRGAGRGFADVDEARRDALPRS